MSETAKRILVVDDDITMRMLYEDLLSGRGYSVITAESAFAALKSVENQIHEAGFDGFVPKPIDVDVLLEIVRRHEPI